MRRPARLHWPGDGLALLRLGGGAVRRLRVGPSAYGQYVIVRMMLIFVGVCVLTFAASISPGACALPADVRRPFSVRNQKMEKSHTLFDQVAVAGATRLTDTLCASRV